MMTTFTDWDILRNLLLAARWTLLLSLVAFVGGTLVTLPLLFMRLLQRKWLTRVIRGYTALFQGTPLLMQLFLAFFGVGLFGIDVAPWTAACASSMPGASLSAARSGRSPTQAPPTRRAGGPASRDSPAGNRLSAGRTPSDRLPRGSAPSYPRAG